MFHTLILAGHLGRDPEMRYLSDGTAVNMTNAAEVEVFTSYQVQKGEVPPSREEARAFYKSAAVV